MSKISTKIKICGLTGPEDVEAVNAAGADYAGFVLFEKSRRYIDFDTAADLLGRLDKRIRSVAVCVDPDAALLGHIEALGFDVIQIHGEMREDLLDAVRTPVWQAVNLSDTERIGNLSDHPRVCGILIDSAEYGSGKTFNWQDCPTAEEIRGAVDGRLFILAGGLNPANVSAGIRQFLPDVVDVSSGVERPDADAPGSADGECTSSLHGRKDRKLIFQFVNEVRKL